MVRLVSTLVSNTCKVYCLALNYWSNTPIYAGSWLLYQVVIYIVCWHTRQSHLSLWRYIFEYFVDLRLEAARQHLIRFVQYEYVQVVYSQFATVDQVLHPPRCPHDHLDAGLQRLQVVFVVLPSDTCVHTHIEVVPQRHHNLYTIRHEYICILTSLCMMY